MKTELIDRIVVEIKAPQGNTLAPEQVANQLRMIADEIDDGMKGNNYTDHMPHEEEHFEVLWEHECTSYGFRIVSDKSLVCQYYYDSEPKPRIMNNGEFPVTTLTRQDLVDAGYDSKSILDDDIESVASRMKKYYHEGYCVSFSEDLKTAADYLGIREKED